MFALDGARGLTGRLDTPDGKPRAVVLVAHCFGGGNDGPAAAAFARGFAERGMAALSLDCAADGASGLDADDLVAAAGQLRAGLGAPGVLIGQARAAAAILAAAGRIPEARAVATVGAPAGDPQLTAALGLPLLTIHEPDGQGAGPDQAPVIAAWAARYLPAAESPDDRSTSMVTSPASSAPGSWTWPDAARYTARCTPRYTSRRPKPGAAGTGPRSRSPRSTRLWREFIIWQLDLATCCRIGVACEE
jgi:hypothetical protein